jgi:AraC-like DNA-binding protein
LSSEADAYCTSVLFLLRKRLQMTPQEQFLALPVESYEQTNKLYNTMLLVPQQLLQSPKAHRSIALDGCTVIESCHYEHSMQGSVYVAEHELIHLRSGRIILQAGAEHLEISAGETVLIKRSAYLAYNKLGLAAGAPYESVLFFLQNHFVEEFLKTHQIRKPASAGLPAMVKIPAHPLLDNFVNSLVPYFDSPLGTNAALLRIKTFEFLLNMTQVAPGLLAYFFELTRFQKADLVQVMEAHYTKNLPLEEFAYLAGRSLAAFKRDFGRLFGTSPHKWLQEKRLKLAHYLLTNTDKSVADAAFEAGYEDMSHFSKVFRRYFGYRPSQAKRLPAVPNES